METTYLKIVRSVNEADGRLIGKSGAAGVTDLGPYGLPGYSDWRLWTNAGFGRRLQGNLRGGDGYSYEVTDFGQYVSVRAAFHNLATGKSVSKTFVIAFDDVKVGDGKVFATSTKWRTISSLDQAANYIKATIQSMTR